MNLRSSLCSAGERARIWLNWRRCTVLDNARRCVSFQSAHGPWSIRAKPRRGWNGDVKKKGEANDAWLRIALRGERLSAALDAHFSALARTVLTPLIEYLEVIS